VRYGELSYLKKIGEVKDEGVQVREGMTSEK